MMGMHGGMVLAALFARTAAPDFGLGRHALGTFLEPGTARRLLGMRLFRLGNRGGNGRNVFDGFLAAERGLDSLDEVHMRAILTRPPAPTRCKKIPTMPVR